MKKMQREVKTYKNIFVSVDGKEFENEADCLAWEKSYKGTMALSWNGISKTEASTVNLGTPWSNDDSECYVLRPTTIEEITVINAYIASSTCNEGNLTIQDIGKLIALDFGYDHDYCSVYVIEDHIKKITDYVAELENRLDKKEANNERNN